MFTIPKPYPKEFREDVIRVARERDPGIGLKQIASDFGISEACLGNWLKAAGVEDGIKSGPTAADRVELREAPDIGSLTVSLVRFEQILRELGTAIELHLGVGCSGAAVAFGS